jgi:hypothetical protein
MANIKISELTAITPPATADELAVVDVSANSTKKTTVGEVVGIINGDVEVANNGTATISELPVSKLQDGAARQLLQTDAAGTGVEWTSNIDVPGTLDVTSAATFDSSVAVTGTLTKSGNNVVTVGDTGTVTSTMILNGTIVDADINASAAIADTKLATISTAGKVSNSATTAASANTASAIVARDASGNFGAGTVTASLTGAASLNVLKAGDTMTGSLSVPLGSAGSPSLTFTGDPNSGLYSPGADQVAFATGGSERARIDSSGRLLVGTSSTSVASTLVLQGNSSAFSTQGILFLARGVNNPSDAQLLGSLNFSDSGHAQCGAVEARRDGGTWTSGSSHPTRLMFSVTADGSASPTEALRISSNRAITVSDGGNVVLGTTTGTKIGTATTQKIGFYNATPVVQPAAVADATTAIDVITQLNDLLAKLRTLGIIAT